MIETPQSFVVREECEKVAWQHGFRRNLGKTGGWVAFGSTTAHGTIYLAAAGSQGPWCLALDHSGVVDELDQTPSSVAGPGLARYTFETLGALYAVMPRVYQLSISLPDAPLKEFIQQTKDLPRTTEAERLVVQRIGQDIFRDRLIEYWGGRCPLTGIEDRALLRASHIKPWADCETDSERLDVHNGLLLSALWDAAFDKGLVTFEDDGLPRFSSSLSPVGRSALHASEGILSGLTDRHRKMLRWHRTEIFQK